MPLHLLRNSILYERHEKGCLFRLVAYFDMRLAADIIKKCDEWSDYSD